jgi:hypothetical protein
MAARKRTTAAQVAAAAYLKAQRAERATRRLARRVRALEAPPENAIGFRVEHDCDEDELPAEVRRK